MSKKGCKWNNCPNYATTFVDMGNRQVPACGGCKRGSMTPNPQANRLDEIDVTLWAKLSAESMIPRHKGEFIFYESDLLRIVKALITEARIDEHKVFWEIVPSDAEHVETLKDISNLRLIKLGAKLDD